MEEVKVGNVVMLQPWVGVDHLQSIWLRFDQPQVNVLRCAKFKVEDIFRHAKHGMVARVSMYWSPPFPPKVWLDWCDDNYLKLCYLEVVG